MSQLIATLPLLACPVGMGVMMWVMMRGNDRQQPPSSDGAGPTAEQQRELDRLRTELDEVRRHETTADKAQQREPHQG